MAKMAKCWLCDEHDNIDNMEKDTENRKRARYAHFSCKEESVYLVADYLRYEAQKVAP